MAEFGVIPFLLSGFAGIAIFVAGIQERSKKKIQVSESKKTRDQGK